MTIKHQIARPGIVAFPSFSLDDLIVPPEADQGEVRSMVAAPAISATLGVKAVYNVDVRNSWVDVNQQTFERFRAYTLELDRQIDQAYAAIGRTTARSSHRKIEAEDLEPFGQAFYDRQLRPALREWYELAPSVAALDHIRRSGPSSAINGIRMDAGSLVVLRLSIDAAAIINRSIVMADIVTEHAVHVLSAMSSTAPGPSTDDRLRFLSLGCGTVAPTAQAAAAITKKSGRTAVLHAVDHDHQAFITAQQDADRWGQDLTTIPCSHLMTEPLSTVRARHRLPAADMVEMTGFLEYVPTEQRSAERLNVTDVIADAYRAVADGGNQITIYQTNDDGQGSTIYDLYLVEKQ